jgi:hypothetical protein
MLLLYNTTILYDSANQNFFLGFRPKVAIYAFRTN